jgi:guanyl-specific ribonuclease Sa
MAPAMPDAAWVLASDAEAWETHARACFAASVDGECPLDVTRKNILNFAQGSFSLVEADLRATLPADLAVAVTEALVREGLAEAFDLRKNLVSLKKVLLHCWHAADPLEHELRRMATFWRDDMNFENGFVQVDRYREVCVAHMRCKGASHAAYDGRVLTKQICCVPRHPDAPRPARLKEMPKSLTTRSWLRQARDALREISRGGDDDVSFRVSSDDVSSGRREESLPREEASSFEAMRVTSRDEAKTKTVVSTEEEPREEELEEEKKTPAREALDAFLASVARRTNDVYGFPLPAHFVASFLERVLIARGGAKALAILHETRSYAAHLEETALAFDNVSALLEKQTRSVESVLRDDIGARVGEEEEVGKQDTTRRETRFRTRGVDYDETAVLSLRSANVHDRLRGLLCGCAPATRDLAWAVGTILKHPSRRLFAAGDHGGADFFPAEFKIGTLIAQHRATVAKWRPVMFAELEAMVPGASAGVLENFSENSGTLPVTKGPEKATDEHQNKTWPPDTAMTPALAYLRGKQACGACGGVFGGLWVQSGTCFRCDAVARNAGVCPKSVPRFGSGSGFHNNKEGKGKKRSKCPVSAWCPHRRRCMACEALFFSECAACGVTRGDGEDVVALVESFDHLCVFLDFDRTLCATKQGASPVRRTTERKEGELLSVPFPFFAEFDAALMSVATSHRETHVVTRNRHVDDIAAFLAHHGVRDAKRKVHNVARGESKAVAIIDVMRKAKRARAEKAKADSSFEAEEHLRFASAVFVDDSIAELVDEEVAAIPGLTRVLFSRVVA